MRKVYLNAPKNEKPNIELKVRRVEANAWVDLGFDKHHYLTSSLNPSCKCLLFTWNEQPVAFAAILNTPRRGIPYSMSLSRIVIIPDFQGLGLFKRIVNFCGGIVKNLSDETHDYRFYLKTAHTKAGLSLDKNPKWRGTVFDGKMRKETTESSGKYKHHLLRKSYCKEYIGEPIEGYDDLLLPIKEMREKKEKTMI